MSPEEKDKNYVHTPSTDPATYRQLEYIVFLLWKKYLYESDFTKSEYADKRLVNIQRADELIKLGLYRIKMARSKEEAETSRNNFLNSIKNEKMSDEVNKLYNGTKQEDKMSDNSKALDKALAVEQRRFLEVIEKMTTLKRPEIIALAKIYGLGDFFQKFSGRIIEKKLGERIAEVVLSILKLRAVRPEFKESICKTANVNPNLASGLRSCLIDKSIGELGEKKDIKRPAAAPVPVPVTAPVPVPAPASTPVLVYVAGKHDGWAEISRD